MNTKNLMIYRVVTGLFTIHMLMTIGVYIFNFQMVSEMFENIGFTSDLIYPLAGAKFLGLIAIWSNKSRLLKELAYAGFAIDFIRERPNRSYRRRADSAESASGHPAHADHPIGPRARRAAPTDDA